MIEVEIDKVRASIEADEEVRKWTKKGWCRMWSDRVMNVLEARPDLFKNVEAREVELTPDYWHTFVCAESMDNDVYYFDGLKFREFEPYFGVESECPEYLRNATRDGILMSERAIRNKKFDK